MDIVDMFDWDLENPLDDLDWADVYDYFKNIIDTLQVGAFAFTTSLLAWPETFVSKLLPVLQFDFNFMTKWWMSVIILLVYFFFSASTLALEIIPEDIGEILVWVIGDTVITGWLFFPVATSLFGAFTCGQAGTFVGGDSDVDCGSGSHVGLIVVSIVCLLFLSILACIKAKADEDTRIANTKDKKLKVRPEVKYYESGKYLAYRLTVVLVTVYWSGSAVGLSLTLAVLSLLPLMYAVVAMPFVNIWLNHFTAARFAVNAWWFVCAIITAGVNNPLNYTSTWLLILFPGVALAASAAVAFRTKAYPLPGTAIPPAERYWKLVVSPQIPVADVDIAKGTAHFTVRDEAGLDTLLLRLQYGAVEPTAGLVDEPKADAPKKQQREYKRALRAAVKTEKFMAGLPEGLRPAWREIIIERATINSHKNPAREETDKPPTTPRPSTIPDGLTTTSATSEDRPPSTPRPSTVPDGLTADPLPETAAANVWSRTAAWLSSGSPLLSSLRRLNFKGFDLEDYAVDLMRTGIAKVSPGPTDVSIAHCSLSSSTLIATAAAAHAAPRLINLSLTNNLADTEAREAIRTAAQAVVRTDVPEELLAARAKLEKTRMPGSDPLPPVGQFSVDV